MSRIIFSVVAPFFILIKNCSLLLFFKSNFCINYIFMYFMKRIISLIPKGLAMFFMRIAKKITSLENKVKVLKTKVFRTTSTINYSKFVCLGVHQFLDISTIQLTRL